MRVVFASLCSLCSLSACGNLPQETPRSVDTTTIQLADPRFPGPPAEMARLDQHCGITESAVWRGSAGIVQILVVEAKQGCVIREPVEQEEALARYFEWLSEPGARFEGPRMKTDASIGVVWGRRLTRADRHCYFFRHSFEAHHFAEDSDPTTFMLGYFCAPPGERMSDQSIHRLIASISFTETPVGPTVAAPSAVAFALVPFGG